MENWLPIPVRILPRKWQTQNMFFHVKPDDIGDRQNSNIYLDNYGHIKFQRNSVETLEIEKKLKTLPKVKAVTSLLGDGGAFLLDDKSIFAWSTIHDTPIYIENQRLSLIE